MPTHRAASHDLLYIYRVRSTSPGLVFEQRLVRAARTLNEISWSDYPPPQFMPTPEVVEMMDGARQLIEPLQHLLCLGKVSLPEHSELTAEEPGLVTQAWVCFLGPQRRWDEGWKSAGNVHRPTCSLSFSSTNAIC